METLEQKFWIRVDKTEGCWTWKTAKDNYGYGRLKYRKRNFSAHRISAAIHQLSCPDGSIFSITSDYLVLHKNECHNRSCCNPAHLYVGTQKQNMHDAIQLGTFSTPFILKVKDEDLPKIKLLRSLGKTYKEIGVLFGISRWQVSNICNLKQRS